MADSNIGTAYVQIVPAATGISNKITTAISPGAQTAGKVAGQKIGGGISAGLQTLGGGLKRTGAFMTGLGAAATAIGGKFVQSAMVTEQSQTKLREVMRAMMNATQGEVDAVNELIDAEAKSGVVGKTTQRSGAQQLATYLHSSDALKTLIPAMNDLAVQQYGTSASSEQLVNISNMMGKVFTGQVGALRRAGISFDENSEKILKNGTEEEKAAELAKVVAQNVGDMNQEFAKTDSGKIAKAKQAISGIGTQIGAQLLPHVAKIATLVSKKVMPKVQKLLDFLAKNPAIAKVAVAITGILAVGGPLLVMLGSLVSSVGALIPVITAVSAPALAIVAAIAAVAAALVYAWKTNEQFRTAVSNLVKQTMPAFKSMLAAILPAIKSVIKIITDLISTIAAQLAPVIKTLTPIITKAVNIMATIFKAKIKIIVAVIQSLANAISVVVIIATKSFNGLASIIKAIWPKITSAIKTAAANIKKYLNFTAIVNAVKNTFAKVGSFISGPFEKAKSLVSRAVSAIKRIFPIKLGKIFSGIKLPHFNISGGKVPWGIGGKGKKPSVSIDWRAKGGIFDSPSVIGIAEASKEAAIPLEGRHMRPFAQAIASEMGGAGTTYNIGDITLSVSDLQDIVTLEQFIAVVKRAKAFGR